MWGSVSCPRTLGYVVQGSRESNHRPSDWQMTDFPPPELKDDKLLKQCLRQQNLEADEEELEISLCGPCIT